MSAFPVTLFHNPRCSKSRSVLDLIRQQGHEPQIVLYKQVGWIEPQLRDLLDRMGVGPRALLRSAEPEAESIGPEASDDTVIAAMIAHPILVERPIVATPMGVVVGRPPERVFEVLNGTGR